MAELTSKYLFIAQHGHRPGTRTPLQRRVQHRALPAAEPDSRRRRRNPLRTQRLVMAMGGQVQEIEIPGMPKHHAVYQLESPDVLTSPEWAEAVDAGRWPEHVRPHTKNRRHVLMKLTYPES